MRALLLLSILLCSFSASASTYAPVYTGGLTTLSTTVANSSAQAIAAAGTRKYLLIQNVSSVNIGCNPFTTAAIGSAGTITLAPLDSIVFESNVISTNAFNCISASGSGNALTVWAVQ